MLGILFTVIVGALAGFLAGKLMKGSGFGFLVNLLVGIVGGFLGGNLLAWLGIHWGKTFIGYLVTALIGSCLLLWILSRLTKKKKKSPHNTTSVTLSQTVTLKKPSDDLNS